MTSAAPARRLGGALAASALVAGGLVVWAGSPAAAVPADCTTITGDTEETEPVTEASPPLVEMRVAEAQELVTNLTGQQAGAGVTVAVVDSGVSSDASLGRQAVNPQVRTGLSARVDYWHGTAVAGVITGQTDPDQEDPPIGIAPGASLVSVKAYDSDGSDEGETIDANGLTEALGLLDDLEIVGGDAGDVRIVVIPVAVTDTSELEAAVDKLTEQGAIVVTSGGNRPTEDGAPFSTELSPYQPGEDARNVLFPAGYVDNPRVVVAGSVVEGDPTGVVVQNSAIDVAVPTAGAVSYGVNGSTCYVTEPSTSLAAGEVAGVLAMLMTAHPDETPDEIVSRLVLTAAGAPPGDAPQRDKTIGDGIVQPYEAIQRPLVFDENGEVDRTTLPAGVDAPAVLPAPEPDLLAGTRSDAVWWGLVGGGALVVALLLRPVLARRRPS